MFGGFATNVKTTGYELTGDLGKCLRMGGLTFYKDFTKSGNLDADFALGSRTATYTSTSGVPTIGANGYAATTANVDVLKYAISKNRTAAQETIVIKFTPNSDFANDGVNRYLFNDDNATRHFRKPTTLTQIRFNADGNTGIVDTSGKTFSQNVSYVITAISFHSSNDPGEGIYINTDAIQSANTNWTNTPLLGATNFIIGASNTGAEQLNGLISWIKIFNRALTAAEIALIV